jgi:hypothetical protein
MAADAALIERVFANVSRKKSLQLRAAINALYRG